MYQAPITKGESFADLVQIAGLVRFSYPCSGGFQRPQSGGSLYAPARMEERFAYFETLCLHSLKGQTDKGFTLGVLVGADMPAPYLARLRRMLAGLPQARLIALPPMPHDEAVTRAFARLFDPGAPLRLSFRLDDDDALALDFIAEARARLPQMLALSGGLDPVGLSFLRGLTLRAGRLWPMVYGRPLGLGLAVLAPAGRRVHAFSYRHQHLHQNMPVLMDPAPMMTLRAFHGSNDSGARLPPGRHLQIGAQALETILARRFGLDPRQLAALSAPG